MAVDPTPLWLSVALEGNIRSLDVEPEPGVNLEKGCFFRHRTQFHYSCMTHSGVGNNALDRGNAGGVRQVALDRNLHIGELSEVDGLKNKLVRKRKV